MFPAGGVIVSGWALPINESPVALTLIGGANTLNPRTLTSESPSGFVTVTLNTPAGSLPGEDAVICVAPTNCTFVAGSPPMSTVAPASCNGRATTWPASLMS